MTLEWDLLVPLATIVAAASAPTIAAIWAGRGARKAAERAAEVKESTAQALTTATMEIEELKRLVAELRARSDHHA